MKRDFTSKIFLEETLNSISSLTFDEQSVVGNVVNFISILEQLSEKVRNVLNQLTSQTCLVFSLKNENDGNWIQFYDGIGYDLCLILQSISVSCNIRIWFSIG